MAPAADNLTVAIESGLHAGVRQELAASRIVLGRDAAADLVLHDDGVEPLHLAVMREGRDLHVEALADGVEIEDVGTLQAGESCRLSLPVGCRIGGATLRWSGPEALPAEPGPWLMRRLAAHRVAVGGACIALMCGGFALARPVSEAARAAGLPVAAEQPAEAPRAPIKLAALPERVTLPGARDEARPAPSGEAAIPLIREEIAKAGLLNVTVAPGAGVVTATGTVEPGATGRWQAVQQWFDEHFAGELTLVNAVVVRAEKLPSSIAIEAVWRGQNPYLIVRGQKYASGSTLDGGWMIERIEAERVLLKRDGRVVAVRY